MERADLGIGMSEQHMFFIFCVIRITDITDRRSTIGPSLLHHKATERNIGDLEDCWKHLLQSLAVRSVLFFKCAPGGNKSVGVLYGTCMEFMCKRASSLVVEV
eukprot:1147898-Pelagomonas_calceolata.AAC.2